MGRTKSLAEAKQTLAKHIMIIATEARQELSHSSDAHDENLSTFEGLNAVSVLLTGYSTVSCMQPRQIVNITFMPEM